MNTHFLGRALALSCLIGIGLLAPVSGTAQGKDLADKLIRLIGIEDSLRVYQIEEIVVERTRASRPVSPVAFTDLGNDEIARISYGQDVPMVLSSTPSTYAYSDAANGFGYTYLKIRGFDQNRLGMQINGVPINDPESHQVYWVDHGDLLAGAKSVQVQRGVGATLFGATSFGGGVNVLTSPLATDPGIHLDAGYGSFTDSNYNLPLRTYRASFASGPIRNGTAALYARYSRQNSDGYRESSAADLESFALSGLHAGTYGDHKLDILIGHERTQFAWDGISPQFGFDLDSREDRRFNVYSIYDNNVDDFQQVISSLTSEFPITDEISITNTAYYIDGEGFFEQFKEDRDLTDYGFDPIELPDSTVIEETDLVQRRWLVNHTWGLLPQLIAPIAEGRLTVGLGLRRYRADHFGEIVWTDVDLPGSPLDRYYSYDTEKTSFEAYAQMQYPIHKGTTLTGALQYQGHRYDWIQKRQGNFKGYNFEVDNDFLNPRFGIKHVFNPDLSVYGSLSYAEREPAESDYVDGDDPSSVPAFKHADQQTHGLNDPIVQPEKVIDYELGASYRQPKWSVGLGLYRLDFRDELIPIDGGRIREEGQLERANANETVHQGIELEATAAPIAGLDLSGNLSLARHRFVDHEIFAYWLNGYDGGRLRFDEKTIPRTPEILGNLIVSYTLGVGTYGAQLRHAGRQFVDAENIESLAIDPFTLLDLSAEVDIGRQFGLSIPLRITARLNNVFDTLYETFGYSYYDDFPARQFAFYWPGPTRSFFLSVGTSL